EIKKYPTIEHLYGDQLVEESVISKDEKSKIIDDVEKEIRSAHDKIDKKDTIVSGEIEHPDFIFEKQKNEVDENITKERLKKIKLKISMTLKKKFEVHTIKSTKKIRM